MSEAALRENGAAAELVACVCSALGLPAPEWEALDGAAGWARWEDLQRMRWRSRARGARGLRFLRITMPFHPRARPRVARAGERVASLYREDPRFWAERSPAFAERARVGEAMGLLRRAESELRRAGDRATLAVCLELQGMLWRGSLDNGFEAQACEAEAAELATAGGWRVQSTAERARAVLWDGWWRVETGEDRWRSSAGPRGE